MSGITLERAHELIDQIFEPGDLDEAIVRIDYLKEELEKLWLEYDLLRIEGHVGVDKIEVFWHDVEFMDVIDEWAIKITYTNGLCEFPIIYKNGSGVGYDHMNWKEPKHYKRCTFIGWIVILGRLEVYNAGDLVMELYSHLNEGKTVHNPALAWRYMCWVKSHQFDQIERWLINKEYK